MAGTKKEYRFDGSSGEEAAAGFLVQGGYSVLHRNWRHGRYEIDLIAEEDGCIVFVEVKTRLYRGVTTPEFAMTRKKFDCLCRAAEFFMETSGGGTKNPGSIWSPWNTTGRKLSPSVT